jgi:small multidrug resistance pump
MNQNTAIFWFLVGALISAFAQILLKRGAMQGYLRWARYINIYVMAGYLMLISVTFITVLAYKGVEFKTGPVLAASSYFFVVFLGWAILKEKLTLKRVSGAALIVAGILLFIWN